MNPDCEKLSKSEVHELDALLTKLMLYLQSVTDSEPDDKFPKRLGKSKKVIRETQQRKRTSEQNPRRKTQTHNSFKMKSRSKEFIQFNLQDRKRIFAF
jgi:hypothetical protein